MEKYNDNNLKSTLVYIKNTFGIEIFLKQEKLIAYISDLAPRLKNEKSMLKRIAQLGILEEFIHCKNTDKTNQEHIITKALKILVDDEYIQEKVATEYVITVAKVLDLDVSKFVSKKAGINAEEIIAVPSIDTVEKIYNKETTTTQNNNSTSNKNHKTVKIIALLLAIILLAQIVKIKLSSKHEPEISRVKDTININTSVTNQDGQNLSVLPATYFSGKGSGISTDPYVITTINNLNEIRNNLSACYILGKNIEFPDTLNWLPIGSENNPFTGTFDGNGYKINNLRINIHGNLKKEGIKNSELGLFGNIENAVIKNLGLENASYNITYEDFDGNDAGFVNVGGIVSVMKTSMISQSYFTGKIACHTGKGIFIRVAAIGCITTDSSNITNCYSNADLYANGASHNTMVSGITAWLTDSIIEKCYVSGNIIGKNSRSYVYAGGINASGGNGYVKNCISILKKLDASGKNSYSDSIGNYSTQTDCTTINSNKVNISTYTSHGWDFKDIWSADKSAYPLLRIFTAHNIKDLNNTNSTNIFSIPHAPQKVSQNAEIQSPSIEPTDNTITASEQTTTQNFKQEIRELSTMTTSQLYELAFQNYIPPNDKRTGIKEDHNKAIKYFLAAAERGHKEAQFWLGYMYIMGQGVQKDDIEAIKWWEKSASQGLALAQFWLAHRYAKGEGVKKDEQRAIKLWRQASKEIPEALEEIKKLENPDLEGAHYFNGHYYKVFYESLTWDEAVKKCEAKKGYLCTITSEEEFNFITSFLPTKGKLFYWLGASDFNSEGIWEWITNEPFTFTRWRNGEPNGGKNENFLAMTNFWNNNWLWNDGNKNDWPSKSQYAYICEWSDKTQLPQFPSKPSSIYAAVIGNRVRIRFSHTTDSAELIKIEEGTPIEIIDSAYDNDGNKWYKVIFSNENNTIKGWIRSDHVILNRIGEFGEHGGKFMRVNGEDVNLRTEPFKPTNSAENRITYLQPGHIVEVLETKKIKNYTWYRVFTLKGEQGWIRGDFLKNK